MPEKTRQQAERDDKPINGEERLLLDTSVKEPTGFLVDFEFKRAHNKSQLIRDGFDATEGAKYACYELHVSDRIYELDPTDSPDLYHVKNISDDGKITIPPGSTFLIFTQEQLDMPPDVFALVFPVGNLYRLGLSPETSFIDPGYCKPFWIIVSNFSPRIVHLQVGDPLARLFAYKLDQRPARVHDGGSRDIKPTVERVLPPNEADLRARGELNVIRSVMDRVDPPHYEHAFVTQCLYNHHRECKDTNLVSIGKRVATAVLVSCLSFLLVLAMVSVLIYRIAHSRWPTLAEGALASFYATVVWALFTFVLPPIRRAFLNSLGTLIGGKE